MLRKHLVFSVLIWISWFVVQVRKRWEGSGSEPIQLVSEHLDFLGLLFCDIQEFAFVCNFFDLFTWIGFVVAHGV